MYRIQVRPEVIERFGFIPSRHDMGFEFTIPATDRGVYDMQSGEWLAPAGVEMHYTVVTRCGGYTPDGRGYLSLVEIETPDYTRPRCPRIRTATGQQCRSVEGHSGNCY